MTFTRKNLSYRVTLDTEQNVFIIFDEQDERRFATGTTIEKAVAKLEQNG
ncbi:MULTISPECIES: hypothetical protein [Enterococcus]|uniref:Uncharacterized protein n=1 Tax=Candidatus Enterococcus ferrettii TaxID=2815324 RepID=A0ABV0ENJ6_9ENTE|nr:hypothetical protein [Enterococcus sp. 665A]MBO1341263.1 hypothetical protein [Enterococcus sp. 665A]